MAFRSVAESMLIMLSVPFAMVGGVFLQWMLGYSMTTAVIVGYISLFAVAVQTGIIMVIFIRAALDTGRTDQSYMDAVIEGSAARLRPKLMTVAAIVLSLLPIMFSSGPGMEIMKPIAAPSIGGMVTLDPARAVHDAVPVCDWRGHPALVGAPRARGAARTPAAPGVDSVGAPRWLERLDRDVEMRGVHDAMALELHPDPVHARPREDEIELHLRTAVGDERMRVDHVDQVVAGRQHVAPGAEILLEAIAGVSVNRICVGSRRRAPADWSRTRPQILGILRRVVARQRRDGRFGARDEDGFA